MSESDSNAPNAQPLTLFSEGTRIAARWPPDRRASGSIRARVSSTERPSASATVRTKPRPNIQCQTRFAITRAVSGFSSLAIVGATSAQTKLPVGDFGGDANPPSKTPHMGKSREKVVDCCLPEPDDEAGASDCCIENTTPGPLLQMPPGDPIGGSSRGNGN